MGCPPRDITTDPTVDAIVGVCISGRDIDRAADTASASYITGRIEKTLPAASPPDRVCGCPDFVVYQRDSSAAVRACSRVQREL
jgi:hypothetical protein